MLLVRFCDWLYQLLSGSPKKTPQANLFLSGFLLVFSLILINAWFVEWSLRKPINHQNQSQLNRIPPRTIVTIHHSIPPSLVTHQETVMVFRLMNLNLIPELIPMMPLIKLMPSHPWTSPMRMNKPKSLMKMNKPKRLFLTPIPSICPRLNSWWHKGLFQNSLQNNPEMSS